MLMAFSRFSTNEQNHLALVTFLFAFASLAYELVIAQLLTALLGGTILRYCTTIGLYTCALGFGSLLADAVSEKKLVRWLIGVEVGLILFGALSAPLLIELVPVLGFGSVALSVLGYLVVVVIGLLSGVELPLLLKLGRAENSLGLLSVDYIAGACAALVVPMVLVPHLDLFVIGGVVALANLAGFGFLLAKTKRRSRL